METNRTQAAGNRRRRLLIDPQQQTRMLMGMALVPSIILAATGAGLAWLYTEIDAQLVRSNVSMPLVLAGFLVATCFLCAAIAVLLWQGLKTSHRVYGPIYRIVRTLTLVREGDWSKRIKLRDGDHLTELADHLNTFLDWLEKRQGGKTAEQHGAATQKPEPAERMS
jgi:hypothetical protein